MNTLKEKLTKAIFEQANRYERKEKMNRAEAERIAAGVISELKKSTLSDLLSVLDSRYQRCEEDY